jgi:hypothetical protein
VPGEETVASGKARDGENLHRFVGEQWRQRGGGCSGIAEGLRRQPYGLALVIAKRAVGADELADTASASKAVW